LKRIEAVVQSEIAKKIVDAIRKEGVSGVTLIQALGQGEGDRPWIGGEGGHQVEFNSTDIILTVVDDDKVDSIVSTIMNNAHTGSKGDGMVFVTNVENSYNITTKQELSRITN
jgi:nitrogen regulatory protein P-II 1